MPRIVKPLPPDRADHSFGDLVYWHLFVHGTRPTGDPGAKAGQPWNLDSICRPLGIGARTLRNWIFDRTLPDSIEEIEEVLFGKAGPNGHGHLFDEQRLELREAWRTARRQRSASRAAGSGPATAPTRDDPSAGERAGQDRAAEDVRAVDADGPDGGDDPPVGSSKAADEDDGDVVDPSDPERPRDAGDGSSGPRRSAPQDLPLEIRTSQERRSREPPVVRGRITFANEATSRPGARLARLLVPGLVIAIGAYAILSRDTSPPRSADKPPFPSAPPAIEARRSDPPRPSAPPAREESSRTDPPPGAGPPKPDAARPAPPEPQAGRTDAARDQAAAREAAERDRRERDLREQTARAEAGARIAQQTIDALKAAHDARLRAEAEDARRRDQEAQAAAKAKAERDWNARQIAGMGFGIMENTGANGSGLGPVVTDSIVKCALACLREDCDGFAFQNEPPGRERSCYRYKGIISYDGNPFYTSGRRNREPEPPKVAAAAPPPALPPLAEDPSRAGGPRQDDGISRCSAGPFKVTGFTLTCDRLLTGGTTLGSTDLAYTVATITECASKCAPVERCTGFAYNASDPEGRRACYLFGGRPGSNAGTGWVSGSR